MESLKTLNKSLYVVGNNGSEITLMTEEKENIQLDFASKALNAVLDSVFLTNLVLFILLYTGTLILFLVGYYILEIIFLSSIACIAWKFYTQKNKM